MPRQKIIASIDAGSSKIATVVASMEEGEEKIRVLGSASIPSRGIKKGNIVTIDDATNAIIESVEATERMAGYNISQVIVGVNGSHIVSQNSRGVVAIADPQNEITPEDVTRVVEAAKAVSLPANREIVDVVTRSFTIDGQEGIADPIGMSGVRLEVETHIVTASVPAIKNLTKCVRETGANIVALVAGGSAAAQTVLTDTEKELGAVMVDIGGGTTSVVIYADGAPVYTSVLPIGARNVTNDLAVGLRVPIDEAEKIKIHLGKKPVEKKNKAEMEEEREDKKSSRPTGADDVMDLAEIGVKADTKTVSRRTLIEGIVRPRLNEIFEKVGEEIKASGQAGLTPAGLILCGGGALTVGVEESVKRTLSLPVKISSARNIAGLIDDLVSPEFAAACGLVEYAFYREIELGKGRSFPRIAGVMQKIPVRGLVERSVDLIKSLLP